MMDKEWTRDILSVLKESLKRLQSDPRPDTPAVAELKRLLSQRIGKMEDAQRTVFARKPL